MLKKMAGSQGHKTKRFWQANLWPVHSYGLPAFGQSPTALKAARITAAKTGQDKSGQCTLSTLFITLGVQRDPEYLALKASIGFCMYLLKTAEGSQEYKDRLSTTWRKTLSRLQKTKNSNSIFWNQVKGPIAALISTLWRVGWKMPTPWLWISPGPDGKLRDMHHTFQGFGDSSALLKEAEIAIVHKAGQAIDGHWSGSGALIGADFEEAKDHWHKLLRFDPTRAGQFLVLATGACWPYARRLQKGMTKHQGGLPQTQGSHRRRLPSLL